MILTYKQIVDSIPAMKELCSREDIPFLTSLKLSKNAIEIDKYAAHYQSEYNKILQECLEKDENGNYIAEHDDPQLGFKIIPEKREILEKKLETLGDFETDVTIEVIPKEEFEGINISPNNVRKILFLIGE